MALVIGVDRVVEATGSCQSSIEVLPCDVQRDFALARRQGRWSLLLADLTDKASGNCSRIHAHFV